jgi:phage baseplate assembly protein W
MAFNARKIYPLDTKPSVAVGIGLPFNGSAVFNSTYLTKDAIKSNLINYFLTDRYERYLNNNFGANLKAFIFEQITNDNTSLLKEDIQAKINEYFNNINVVSLEIDSLPDTNEITIRLTYNVPNTNISDKIEITF